MCNIFDDLKLGKKQESIDELTDQHEVYPLYFITVSAYF